MLSPVKPCQRPRRFRTIRNFPRKMLSTLRATRFPFHKSCVEPDVTITHSTYLPVIKAVSLPVYEDDVDFEGDDFTDEIDDITDYDSVSQRCSCVSTMTTTTVSNLPIMDLFALPTKLLERIIRLLDTSSLHAFRHTSHRAQKISAFRGILTHMLCIDPEVVPGQISSIRSKSKIVTSAALDAVLDNDPVRVRLLLKIGDFHAASLALLADHIQGRYHSIVFEGQITYRTLQQFLQSDQNIVLRLKGGLRLPTSDNHRFFTYFVERKVAKIRNACNASHLFIKAIHDTLTMTHSLRVIPSFNYVL